MRLKILGASAGAIALFAVVTPFVAAKQTSMTSVADMRAEVLRCFDVYDQSAASAGIDTHGASATVLARVRLRQCIFRALTNHQDNRDTKDNDDDNGHHHSSSSSAMSSSSVSSSSASSTSSSVSSSSGTMMKTVSISDFAYAPSSITVKKGTIVVWTNTDTAKHTVTRDGRWWWSAGPMSGSLTNGQSYSYTFNSTGEFDYHCQFHPDMKGTVIVTD